MSNHNFYKFTYLHITPYTNPILRVTGIHVHSLLHSCVVVFVVIIVFGAFFVVVIFCGFFFVCFLLSFFCCCYFCFVIVVVFLGIHLISSGLAIVCPVHLYKLP